MEERNINHKNSLLNLSQHPVNNYRKKRLCDPQMKISDLTNSSFWVDDWMFWLWYCTGESNCIDSILCHFTNIQKVPYSLGQERFQLKHPLNWWLKKMLNNQYTCRLTNEVPRFEMSTFSNSQLSANYADYKTQPGMVCQLKISSSGQLYPHHSK